MNGIVRRLYLGSEEKTEVDVVSSQYVNDGFMFSVDWSTTMKTRTTYYETFFYDSTSFREKKTKV